MNTEIDNLTMEEVLLKIKSLIKEEKNSYVVTPNVDHIVKLETDECLQKIYKEANLILADGKPLIWISKIYRHPIKEKVSGADLFPKLCKLAAENGYKMFFLGAADGIAAKAASKLVLKYPGLQVADTYSPPFGFEKDENEINKILQRIREANIHILIVGLGCPKQEKFIYKYRNIMNVPISLGLGACFDFQAEAIKRAPRWMCDCGFEWLYRITQEPNRMIKRYLIEDKRIISLVWKYRKV